MMADLRPPLPPEHLYSYRYVDASDDNSSRYSINLPDVDADGHADVNENMKDKRISTKLELELKFASSQHHHHHHHQSIIEGSPFLLKILSNMYTSNLQLKLSTETNFTSFVLFHRFLSHYLHHHLHHCDHHDDDHRHQPQPQPQHHADSDYLSEKIRTSMPTLTLSLTSKSTSTSTSTLTWSKEERKELSNVAAASIFLACKLNNEQRRIRDVINMKHVLQFDSDCPTMSMSHGQGRGQGQGHGHGQQQQQQQKPRPLSPPKLDEEYWKQKEEMVKIEQTLLRVIRFDVNVSYPHRVMVVLWEELVKVTIECVTCIMTTTTTTEDVLVDQDEGDDSLHSQVQSKSERSANDDSHSNSNPQCIRKENIKQIDWLPWWRGVLKNAWKRINDSVFHIDALSCGAADVACAAISLALSDQRDASFLIQDNHQGDGGQGQNQDKDHDKHEIDALLQRQCFSNWWEWVGVEKTSMKIAEVRLVEASKVLCRLR